MKQIILFTLILLALSCKAQNPIIALGDYNTEIVNGAYLKDTNYPDGPKPANNQKEGR